MRCGGEVRQYSRSIIWERMGQPSGLRLNQARFTMGSALSAREEEYLLIGNSTPYYLPSSYLPLLLPPAAPPVVLAPAGQVIHWSGLVQPHGPGS
jgi:hypothetical protein